MSVFCVWFTGLSGSGKTTTAEALVAELDRVRVASVLLDGDAIRGTTSPPLGFSAEDRARNVRRICDLATEALAGGRVAVCAAISPFAAGRAECRARIGSERFIEVFVDTPLAVCRHRDPKGLYARAERGALINVSGLDALYERPASPQLVIETEKVTAAANAARIVRYLRGAGLLSTDD